MNAWVYYAGYFGAALLVSWLMSLRLPERLGRMGLYDKKSLPIKKPTAGGVAIAIPALTLVAITVMVNPEFMDGGQGRLFGFLIGAVIITALGLYDDTRGASPIVKLAVQGAAGVVLVASGIRMGEITNPFASPFEPGVWGDVILIAWIIVITNAVNLIDGIDGLASGICLISSFTLFVIADRKSVV